MRPVLIHLLKKKCLFTAKSTEHIKNNKTVHHQDSQMSLFWIQSMPTEKKQVQSFWDPGDQVLA